MTDAHAVLLENSVAFEAQQKESRHAAVLANHLNTYIESFLGQKGEKGAESTEEHVRRLAKIESAKTYFFTEGKLGIPLERIAQCYSSLVAPADREEARAFEKAIEEHSFFVAERAFDQQVENSEQYASHGFDHSLNVVGYTEQIIRENPELISTMTTKYGISHVEAHFMLTQVAFFHDFGYFAIQSKSKAVHSVAGADIASTPQVRTLFEGLIQSPDANKNLLLHDFQEAILFHNADKIDHQFSAKVITTQGDFLTSAEHIVEVISIFQDPSQNPSGTTRETREIFVSDERQKEEMENLLKDLSRPIVVTVKPLEKFRGRRMDLREKSDSKIGLEKRHIKASELPLHAVVRLADNMDMTKDRLTVLQNEPAFRSIYHAMGDGQEVSSILAELEDLTEEVRKEGAQMGQEILDRAKGYLVRGANLLGVSNDVLQNQLDALKNPSDGEMALKKFFIDTVLQRDFPDLSAKLRDEIRFTTLFLDSRQIRHFGGFESLERVTFVGNEVVVVVNPEAFRDLNKTQVEERYIDEQGNIAIKTVGIGEYQLWRAMDAFSTVTIGGKHVNIRVVDARGDAVPSLSAQDLAMAA